MKYEIAVGAHSYGKYPFFLDLCINFLSGRHFLELNSFCFREVFTCDIVSLKKMTTCQNCFHPVPTSPASQ